MCGYSFLQKNILVKAIMPLCEIVLNNSIPSQLSMLTNQIKNFWYSNGIAYSLNF